MRPLSRRRFLWTSLGACGPLGLGLAAWRQYRGRHAERVEDAGVPFGLGGLEAFAQSSWALGSEVSITALHADREVARQAVEAAMAELRLVEGVMSLYRPQSQLCRLNRVGILVAPHPYLVEVLRRAQAMSAQTGGAFDVTVQPLWLLYAEAKKTGRLPATPAIAAVTGGESRSPPPRSDSTATAPP
jgi:thiamine biosynthesis lipoprotein